MARDLKINIVVDDHGAIRTLQSVEGEIRDVGEASQRSGKSVSGLGSVLRTAAGTFAGFVSAQAVMRGVGAAFRFARDSAIGMNSTLETATLQFANLLGDTQRAEEHVRSLFDFAASTPYETGPIIEASRLMQVFGGDALNTTENLRLVGDTAAATGTPINELGMWVGRLHAALEGGQPIGEATLRLMEMGAISPKVTSELREMQKANVAGNEIWKVVKNTLAENTGQMQALQGTWQGVTSTLIDNAQLAIADAFGPLFEAAKDGINGIIQVFNSGGLQDSVGAIRDALAGAFGGDQQERVETIRDMILNFASLSARSAALVIRGWAVVETLWNGLVLVVGQLSEGILRFVRSAANLANRIPGVRGSLDGLVETMDENVEVADRATESYKRNLAASADAAMGGTDLSNALTDLADSFEASTVQTQAGTAALAGGSGGGGVGGGSPGGGGGASAGGYAGAAQVAATNIDELRKKEDELLVSLVSMRIETENGVRKWVEYSDIVDTISKERLPGLNDGFIDLDGTMNGTVKPTVKSTGQSFLDEFGSGGRVTNAIATFFDATGRTGSFANYVQIGMDFVNQNWASALGGMVSAFSGAVSKMSSKWSSFLLDIASSVIPGLGPVVDWLFGNPSTTGRPAEPPGGHPDVPKDEGEFAQGGLIRGFSTRHRPIMAQAGEFVMSRPAVNRIGVPSLSAMNRGQGGTGASVVNSFTFNGFSGSERDARRITDMVMDRMSRDLAFRGRRTAGVVR